MQLTLNALQDTNTRRMTIVQCEAGSIKDILDVIMIMSMILTQWLCQERGGTLGWSSRLKLTDILLRTHFKYSFTVG